MIYIFKAQISFSKSEFYVNWILIYCKMNFTVSHFRTEDKFPLSICFRQFGHFYKTEGFGINFLWWLLLLQRLRALFGLWASSPFREYVWVKNTWTFKPVGPVLRFQSEQFSWIEFLIQAWKLKLVPYLMIIEVLKFYIFTMLRYAVILA